MGRQPVPEQQPEALSTASEVSSSSWGWPTSMLGLSNAKLGQGDMLIQQLMEQTCPDLGRSGGMGCE